MSMKFNLVKIINECNEISGKSVLFSLHINGDLFEFNFSWFDDEDCEFIDDTPENNISYTLAKFEIEKFVSDIDEVLIGKFKFEFER